MSCPGQQLENRKYPRKQPPAWKPPVPRWQLSFPTTTTEIHILYVGVQSHTDSSPTENPTFAAAVASINDWLSTYPPDVLDAFITETTLAHDLPQSRVWVAYFTDRAKFTAARNALDLPGRWRSLSSSASASSTSSSPSSTSSSSSSSAAGGIGLWTESFSTPIARLETNYAGLHEKPGLARLPIVTAERHELSAYWGAARDRIPASAEDLFEVPGSKLPEAVTNGAGNDDEDGEGDGLKEISEDKDGKPTTKWHVTDALTTTSSDPSVQFPAAHDVPRGYGQVLRGTNYDNITHIRSGQCWAQCPPDEAAAYTREGGLQEKLMKGMAYLWEHPDKTGTLGLRWLRNVQPRPAEPAGGGGAGGNEVVSINETCGAGFFRNLKDLENWSSTHPSHMAIFTGAHKHAREWGKDRKFMTWHEVSVLKEGEASWEYVNCDPQTGVVRFVRMGSVEELETRKK